MENKSFSNWLEANRPPRVKFVSKQLRGSWSIDNGEVGLSLYFHSILNNQEPSIEFEIVNSQTNTSSKQGDIISRYQVQITNLINKILETELKANLNDKINYFKFTIKSYDGHLTWTLGYKIAQNLENIVKSVSNNIFSHPFGRNKIETNTISQFSGATEFVQYFSKDINNDIDWRPTETVPDDFYAQ